MTTQQDLERELALTRQLLGYCMSALDSIIAGAPRSEPAGDDVETIDDAENFGWAAARFNDALLAGIAKSQTAWLRQACRHATTAGDVKRCAEHLKHSGYGAPPAVTPLEV